MDKQKSSTIAKVILNINPVHLDHPFDYLVPKDLEHNAQIGVRVRVRFRGKLTDGFIIDRVDNSKIKSLIPIHKIYSDLPLLNKSTWNFCKEVAVRYCSKHYDVLRHMVPSRHAGVEKKILHNFNNKQQCNNFVKPMPDITKLDILPSLKKILENLNSTSNSIKINLQLLRSTGKQSWDHMLAIVIIAYANAGLGVIAVMPDSQDVDILYKRLLQFISSDNLATLTFNQGKESRYKNFCEIILGLKRIVIGTRSSIYSPVHNLGMIIIWDELDPSHQEVSNPYTHTRDLALLRSSLENTSLLFASFSVSCAIQRLIEKSYLQKITYERTFLRDLTPIMQSTVNDISLPEYAYKKHLPDTVFKIIRNNLKKGPVLIQIQSARTKSYLSCNNCNYIARCMKCNGTIEYINDILICKLCSCKQNPWICKECKYMQLQSKMSESERIIKELGFSFPDIPIMSSYKGHIIKEIPNKNILVISTPGSEPFASYGYSAAIILNADFQLNQPYLNAGEQAFARWLKVASLVRVHPDKGIVLLVSNNQEVSNNFIQWNPNRYIHNQLIDRYELELPPSIRIAIIEGYKQDIQSCINDINIFNQKIIGPYPLISSDSNVNSNIKHRAVIKFNYKTGKDIVKNIKNSKIKLSLLHKANHLYIKIDANYLL